MSALTKRIISGIMAMLVSLTAVASTLPPDTTFAQIPMMSWMIALLAFFTGFYSPKEPAPVPDEPEVPKSAVPTQEEKPQ